MKLRAKDIFSGAITHSIKTQGIKKGDVVQLVKNPDREQIVEPKKGYEIDSSTRFLIKYFEDNDFYLFGVFTTDKKESLSEIFTLYANLMEDIENTELYAVYKEIALEFGLPFRIGTEENTFVEYAEKYIPARAEGDSIDLVAGDQPEDTAFSIHLRIKMLEVEEGKKVIYYMSFVLNDTEYLHWLHEQRIKRRKKVRVILPEGHIFPPSITFKDFKQKISLIRDKGTVYVGLDLFPLLMAQNRFYSTLFCYKYEKFELALYIERSVDLVLQHYDDDFDHLREARISLRGLPLAQEGAITVGWNRNQTLLMIGDSNQNLIAKASAT